MFTACKEREAIINKRGGEKGEREDGEGEREGTSYAAYLRCETEGGLAQVRGRWGCVAGFGQLVGVQDVLYF
jgi:hypothetical protein